MKYSLVCPHCEAKFSYTKTLHKSDCEVVCPTCKEGFDVLVVKIRAKRSRGNRKAEARKFEVRVVEMSGTERLLQFENDNYDDFELRQGDEVAFYYVDGELQSVYNFTIDKVYVIGASSCYLATYVYGSESEEVASLREFRDRVLLPHPALAELVYLYYWASPKMIRLFGDSRYCRRVVAALLHPLAWSARRLTCSARRTRR